MVKNPDYNTDRFIGLGPVPQEQLLRTGVDIEPEEAYRQVMQDNIPHVIDEDGWVEPRRDLIDAIQARYGEDFGDFIYSAAMLYLNPNIPDFREDDHEFRGPKSDFNMYTFIQCIMSDIRCLTLGGIVTDIRLNDRDHDANNYPQESN